MMSTSEHQQATYFEVTNWVRFLLKSNNEKRKTTKDLKSGNIVFHTVVSARGCLQILCGY